MKKIVKRALLAVFILGLYAAAASLYISDRSGVYMVIGRAMAFLHIFTRSSKVYTIIFLIIADIILALWWLSATSKDPSWKKRLFSIVCAVFIVGSIVAPIGYEIYKGFLIRPFRNDLATYASIEAISNSAPSPEEASELAKTIPSAGRVVVINMETKKIYKALYFGLPESLRARGPDEVVTVVQVENEKVQSGTYTDGAAAYRNRCNITVIDFKTHRAITRDSLTGLNPPPHAKTGFGSRSGSYVPDLMIINYIIGVLKDHQTVPFENSSPP